MKPKPLKKEDISYCNILSNLPDDPDFPEGSFKVVEIEKLELATEWLKSKAITRCLKCHTIFDQKLDKCEACQYSSKVEWLIEFNKIDKAFEGVINEDLPKPNELVDKDVNG